MDELVMAEVGGLLKPVSSSLAETDDLNVVDESPYNEDGSVKAARRANGREDKPKTTVATEAAKKKS